MANKYIIFLIILIIIIWFYFNRKEKFRVKKIKRNYDDGVYRDKNTWGIDRMSEDKPWYHVVNKLVGNTKKDKKNNKLIIKDNYDTMTDYDEKEDNIQIERFEDRKFTDVDGNIMSAKQSSKDMKEYIKNVVLNGKDDCYCVGDKTPYESNDKQKEINDYRESQLDFRSKIYGSSQPYMDEVDKINLFDEDKNDCKTIAEIHDKIIGNASTLNIKPNNNIIGYENQETEFVKHLFI
jgi:hypothetical protein